VNFETINMGSYNLHLIKTKKFKTISIDIHFLREIKKDEITKRNLLKMILLNSTKNYKSEKELMTQSEELYDIKVSSSSSRVGNYSDLSFQTKFLNEKYTEEDMNRESIIFFLDLIFNPNINNNSFVEIDKVKNKLRDDILSLKDNKAKYAILKLMEKMKSKPYSYNTYGNLEDLDNINGKNLYEYYNKVLKEDQIDIFVLGDFQTNQIKEIFKEYFKVNTFKKNNKNIIVKELEPRKRIVKYKEEDNVKQAQLTIICNINNLTDEERRYALKLYSEVLGGSSNSVLFQNIREKHGYCYYINSYAKAYDNILIINSGIEKDNIDKCLKLIRKCMKNINDGKFDEEVLEASKKMVISAIKATTDTSYGVMNSYLSKVLVGSDEDEVRIEKFNKVNKEDIIRVSKKVKMHTVLTLEKGDNSENDKD